MLHFRSAICLVDSMMPQEMAEGSSDGIKTSGAETIASKSRELKSVLSLEVPKTLILYSASFPKRAGSRLHVRQGGF